MKKISLFLFVLFVTNLLMSQCPNNASDYTSDKCMSISWTTPPSPLPSSLVENGETFNLESGLGTTASPAIYRKVGATGSCSSAITFTGILSIPGNTCEYLNGSLIAVLPTRWLNFYIDQSSNKSVLKWTVSENDIKHFKIYGSLDGVNFNSIATIASKGNGTFSYEINLGATFNFYKVESVSLSGRSEFTSIIKNANLINVKFKITPNPSTNSFFLYANDLSFINKMVNIFDISGKIVLSQRISSQIQLIDVTELTSGMYFAKFENGQVEKLQIVK